MKRFIFTILLCASLLGSLSLFLFPVTHAAENPLLALLNLPAPPPVNPQVTLPSTVYSEKFYSKSNPPSDDAPIDELLDYWHKQSESYAELGYNPKPSPKVLDRLMAEVEKDPSKVHQFLNAFRGSEKAADLVKQIYDRSIPRDEDERSARAALRHWLTYNSPYFSSELVREASRVGDVNEYVSNQEPFLALARVDWERARPIVDRLYSGNQKVSRVLAQWALYRHALDENSFGDIERYREELKAVVEDKTATGGMRDLAFDALVKEKEWSGRDDWYYSLLSDETLDDIQVNGRTYTGLTTIMYYSPDEAYIDKMVELVKSDNKAVRTAAAKNLLKRVHTRNPEVLRALLPWLEDPKWINATDGSRNEIVSALAHVKLPESVPALVAALDEKNKRVSYAHAVNAMNAAANAAMSAARAANNTTYSVAVSNMAQPGLETEDYYPLRYSAVSALAFQEDPRAVPALRKVLNDLEQPYEKNSVVIALLKCGGFTIAEQVDAIEYVARNVETLKDAANTITNGAVYFPAVDRDSMTDIRQIIGIQLTGSVFVSDELARAVVDRITALDKTDATTSREMRKIVLNWISPAVNMLLLRDLKNGRADSDSIVRLLAFRGELRHQNLSDVSALRTGGGTAVGISACLLEDVNDYDAILNSDSDETKIALLACARLIRAKLPVPKVAANLVSKDKLLALAAERYIESEDSPEARRIVLSLHPNEAKILGATTAFYSSPGVGVTSSTFLVAVFGSANPFFSYPQSNYSGEDGSGTAINEIEKRLQEELKNNTELLGVYNWEENFVRIYKDKAVLSWEQDPARYRERVLTAEEFENIKGLLAHYKADELPPFLSCFREGCETQQLLMLGRSGGRRVFVRASTLPPLFADLRRMFEEMRRPPSTIKYWAAKDIPGLEVLFADDRLDAIAVWKNGSDLRLLTADKARRAEIDEELASFNPPVEESEKAESENGPDDALESAFAAEKARREYENFTWFDFSAGTLGSTTDQPADAEYIPVKDNLSVPADAGRWKSRTGAAEIRTDEKGLYKVSAGRLTKIKTGPYGSPVITANGRWVVATKYDNETGGALVRINLLTNREFVIDPGDFPAHRAIAYVPSLGRVLVGPYDDSEYGYDVEEVDESPERPSRRYFWLDPETGSLVPTRGEIRPLVQQTYRGLQPTAKPGEFWAALAGDNDTVIGIYQPRTLTMKPVLKLAKLDFDSMQMWVDEPGGKAYFVYEGHLLSVPLNRGK